MRLKQLLTKLIAICLLSCFSMASFAENGGSFPWKWGSECPFPWESIDGYWEVLDPDTALIEGYLDFEVIGDLPNGSRFFEIRLYDASQSLVASGHGTSPMSNKIVRALLIETEFGRNRGYSTYLAFVRAYDSNKNEKCLNDGLVRAVTFRSTNSCKVDPDEHLIMHKVPDDFRRYQSRKRR